MIEVTNVSKRYGKRAALENVTLTLHPGEVTLLLGANGAGKSTLLRCLLGITSFEGTIRVDGMDPLREGRAVRAQIGYMPQTGGLHPDLTVAETMAFYAEIRGAAHDRCSPLLEEAALTKHRDTKVGELSGGMRQRLGFAVALITDPHILVLDEPSASLDAVSRQWLATRLRVMADQGRTVLVSTHAGQELLEAGDRRVILEDGQLVLSDAGNAAPARAPQQRESPPRAARGVGRVRPIVAKELRDSASSRWVMGYAGILAALGLAATASGLDSTSGLALQAYGRTTATLTNLCLLLAPLVAVLMAAGSIAGEQERGTLEHLLAQPLSRTGLLLGKHAGLLAALLVATVAGFLPAGVLIAAAGGPSMLAHYLLFPGIAILAGAAMAGVGLLISVTSRSAVQAQGTAVFTWFAFVLLYDLVLMGALALSGLPAGGLAVSLVANPVDAARVLAVLALEPDLYLLGPAGAYLTTLFSARGTATLLLTALTLWAIVPAAIAALRFSIPLRRMRRHEEETRIRVAAGRPAAGTGTGDRVHVERVARLQE